MSDSITFLIIKIAALIACVIFLTGMALPMFTRVVSGPCWEAAKSEISSIRSEFYKLDIGEKTKKTINKGKCIDRFAFLNIESVPSLAREFKISDLCEGDRQAYFIVIPDYKSSLFNWKEEYEKRIKQVKPSCLMASCKECRFTSNVQIIGEKDKVEKFCAVLERPNSETYKITYSEGECE